MDPIKISGRKPPQGFTPIVDADLLFIGAYLDMHPEICKYPVDYQVIDCLMVDTDMRTGLFPYTERELAAKFRAELSEHLGHTVSRPSSTNVRAAFSRLEKIGIVAAVRFGSDRAPYLYALRPLDRARRQIVERHLGIQTEQTT